MTTFPISVQLVNSIKFYDVKKIENKHSGLIILPLSLFFSLKNFYKLSVWVFPELPPLETVATVEVIHVNRKKKVWNYNYDDENDIENEAAPHLNSGGYTKHGLTGKLCPTSTTSASVEDCSVEDCSEPSAEEPYLPEPKGDAETPMAPGPGPWQSEGTSGGYQTRGTLWQDPTSEEDSDSTEGSEGRIVFNVNLNSVCVRALEDDKDSEVTLMSHLVQKRQSSWRTSTRQNQAFWWPVKKGHSCPSPTALRSARGPKMLLLIKVTLLSQMLTWRMGI